jgi:hypothetical protein
MFFIYKAGYDLLEMEVLLTAGLIDAKVESQSENHVPLDDLPYGEEKIEVILKASAQIAYYFKRRIILPNQVIEKELEDFNIKIEFQELISPKEYNFAYKLANIIKIIKKFSHPLPLNIFTKNKFSDLSNLTFLVKSFFR